MLQRSKSAMKPAMPAMHIGTRRAGLPARPAFISLHDNTINTGYARASLHGPSREEYKHAARPLQARPSGQRSHGLGGYGHAIVARVAERHLTATAREQIDASAPGIQLMSLSSTMERKEATDRMWKTRPPDIAAWPFHSDPLQAALQPETGSRQCAGAKIREHLAIIANEERSPNPRKTSQAFMVHLIGDIHQPLRTATDNDRSGKTVMLPPRQTRPARRPAPSDAPLSLFDLRDPVLLKTALALPARQHPTAAVPGAPQRARSKDRGSAVAPDRPSPARAPFEPWPQEVLRVEAHARDLEATHAGMHHGMAARHAGPLDRGRAPAGAPPCPSPAAADRHGGNGG